ncbi:galactose/methyl galactoside import ATP-binding protein MglA [Spirochaetia bacterium]|nr:galactose/methyl galactoside import ATP-binding protein MglA [Spirochaetia bacterium]
MEQAFVEMRNIKKFFPGVRALDDVSLTIEKGRVHALMGENGAGKSTLMKCLFGLYHPDEGEILIENVPHKLVNPRAAMDAGIAMIHQELHPVKTRSVMENVWMGRVPCKKIAGINWMEKKKMYRDTLRLFEELSIQIDPEKMAGELSVAHCQLLEIAKAISINARLIIMDEPTSSLTDTETKLLFNIIEKLVSQGRSIVYISHKIDEILKISHNVSIMRDGKMVGTWQAGDLTENLIINRMVGRDLTNRFPPHQRRADDVYMKIENFTSLDPLSFKNINFELRRGEILGIGGLVGSQRTELVESLFGLRRLKTGTITIKGKTVKVTQPLTAIRNGMAMLTEDRRGSGIIPGLSLVENTVVANQTAYTKKYTVGGLFISRQKKIQDTQKYIDLFSIKTPSVRQEIQNLSGGNQQKVLLGRWILTEPEILLLDEPTRGIDVGAKYDIYSLMEELVAQGKCIIMISSEMPELLGMSDRILVMCEGRLSGTVNRDEATEEKIMYYASADRSAG